MIAQISIDDFRRVFSECVRDGAETRKKCILSCRFSLTNAEFERLLHARFEAAEKAFYFEKPQNDHIICAIGKVASITGAGRTRFADLGNRALEYEYRSFQQNNGWNAGAVPLWVGSMSFFPEHTDRLWKDYSPSDWFIPEFLLIRNGQNCFASFQTNPERDAEYERPLERMTAYLNGSAPRPESVNESLPAIRREHDEREQYDWMENVGKTVESIRLGIVDKVVLSRCVRFRGVPRERLIRALLDYGKREPGSEGQPAAKPAGYNFMYQSQNSLFLGISPEMLATFRNGKVFCDAIAGSIGRGGTEEEDADLGNELLRSYKNQSEHEFVVKHIESVLMRHCADVRIDRFPVLRKISYIQHLYTGGTGTLKPDVSMFRVLRDLHPTPAVGGYPIDGALEMIRSLETYDRGLYTGFIGWFDAQGNGEFAVALRSALLAEDTLHAFAGGGIVSDSRPGDEFQETEIKLHAIISLLRS
jgi:menaquinone-specific isochorismate synthase